MSHDSTFKGCSNYEVFSQGVTGSTDQWASRDSLVCLRTLTPYLRPPSPGGATTNGPDATTPQLSVETWGGGGGLGGSGGGGVGWGGGFRVWGGGARWGGLRATHYYDMHTSRGGVCLGVWGYGGMYAIKALSRQCREESLKGRRVAPIPPPPSPLVPPRHPVSL